MPRPAAALVLSSCSSSSEPIADALQALVKLDSKTSLRNSFDSGSHSRVSQQIRTACRPRI